MHLLGKTRRRVPENGAKRFEDPGDSIPGPLVIEQSDRRLSIVPTEVTLKDRFNPERVVQNDRVSECNEVWCKVMKSLQAAIGSLGPPLGLL